MMHDTSVWSNTRTIIHIYSMYRVQVNEGVREKENSDRLEWLQTHVLCDGLEEQLVFNSLTNSLGPRKLVHYGILHKVITDIIRGCRRIIFVTSFATSTLYRFI